VDEAAVVAAVVVQLFRTATMRADLSRDVVAVHGPRFVSLLTADANTLVLLITLSMSINDQLLRF
jgi:hypothetical protein